MSARSLERIQEKLCRNDAEIRALQEKREQLLKELKAACSHPKNRRLQTGTGEVCGVCTKVLECYLPHIGNHI